MQVKPLAIQCIVIVIDDDVMSQSREQRLNTKEHITHTSLIVLFKPGLYSSTLEIKLFLKKYLSRNSYNLKRAPSC